jgi:hypothetical protein
MLNGYHTISLPQIDDISHESRPATIASYDCLIVKGYRVFPSSSSSSSSSSLDLDS